MAVAYCQRDPLVSLYRIGRHTVAIRVAQPQRVLGLRRRLAGRGVPIPIEVLARDFSEPNPEHPAVRDALIDVYRTRPELTLVCERLVDLDEGLQEWRYRHVKMVERTIGFKPGTGGSAGADYLRSTLFRPLFPDLWTIRGSF